MAFIFSLKLVVHVPKTFIFSRIFDVVWKLSANTLAGFFNFKAIGYKIIYFPKLSHVPCFTGTSRLVIAYC